MKNFLIVLFSFFLFACGGSGGSGGPGTAPIITDIKTVVKNGFDYDETTTFKAGDKANAYIYATDPDLDISEIEFAFYYPDDSTVFIGPTVDQLPVQTIQDIYYFWNEDLDIPKIEGRVRLECRITDSKGKSSPPYSTYFTVQDGETPRIRNVELHEYSGQITGDITSFSPGDELFIAISVIDEDLDIVEMTYTFFYPDNTTIYLGPFTENLSSQSGTYDDYEQISGTTIPDISGQVRLECVVKDSKGHTSTAFVKYFNVE